ncbi:P-loop containing nucleoside triphosphate hydrolase protein, partial [Suillus paluster]|uniref:P-loop containing nucleoside triphosphate hydrolase protein n=1 Tax=Suillus paluster TaxID=48578 RepID=UPI001B86D00F
MSERSSDQYNETRQTNRTNRTRCRSVGPVHIDDNFEVESEGHPVTCRNIVIFGETGVGKSSLINLIAGKDVASTSPDALSCTTEDHAYEVDIRGKTYTLHDTVGLGEGSHGLVPEDVASKKLKSFLRKISRDGGLHLLVYCVRGSRATRALLRSYKTFAAAVAGMKIPVVLAVTCIDDFSEAGIWWERNEKILEGFGIQFDAHAC